MFTAQLVFQCVAAAGRLWDCDTMIKIINFGFWCVEEAQQAKWLLNEFDVVDTSFSAILSLTQPYSLVWSLRFDFSHIIKQEAFECTNESGTHDYFMEVACANFVYTEYFVSICNAWNVIWFLLQWLLLYQRFVEIQFNRIESANAVKDQSKHSPSRH